MDANDTNFGLEHATVENNPGGGVLRENSSRERITASVADDASSGELPSEKQPAESVAGSSHGDSSTKSNGSDSAGQSVPQQRSYSFAQMEYDTHARYVVTPQGVFHLTPTELRLVRTLEELGETSVSKLDLSIRLQCNKRVVGRLISNLRHEGVIETEAQYSDSGAQLANTYRIADDVRPLAPGEEPPADGSASE